MTITTAPIAVARRAWSALGWYVKGVLGERAYQQYLDHHRRMTDAGPALTEREFWRRRSDWQDRHPQGRCC